tara:strand:- start:88 stop:1653 length:1566 start_codon:yes stop_codon:yes gene_type:complete
VKQIKDIPDNIKVWPMQEAVGLHKHLHGLNENKDKITFQTGYGPSGLPHIGTFGEVMRTSMVRHSFERLYGLKTKLLCFSDDLDGLRKVPENIPNRDLLQQDLELPLSQVTDPFGTHKSFAEHNNSKLCEFLDSFQFEYEFISSTKCYSEGIFNEALVQVLAKYDEIMEVMLPSLGAERKLTYSPFLPISRESGKVLQVPTLEIDAKTHSIVYEDVDGKKVKTPVTDGNVKLQWKADWAMRWFALSVDYEMYGKDLIPSANLASKICRLLGRKAPYQFFYELFLDDKGQKISKSKGNGLSVEEWLRYGSKNSLGLFMFQKPKTAKRLYFDSIPRAVDDYHKFLETYQKQSEKDKYQNPVWHLHEGSPPESELLVSFSMLMNLAGATGSTNVETLLSFVQKYLSDTKNSMNPTMQGAMHNAINYFDDFLKSTRVFKKPSAIESDALVVLTNRLQALGDDWDASEIQQVILDVGKQRGFENNRDWFTLIYEVLLGSQSGPRLGSFFSLLGKAKTVEKLNEVLR